MELSSDALKEGAVFFEQAERAPEACRAVVEGKLARQLQSPITIMSSAKPTPAPFVNTDERESSSLTPSPGTNGSGATPDRERPADRSTTLHQLQAIERLALRIGANPSEWLQERFGDTPPTISALRKRAR